MVAWPFRAVSSTGIPMDNARFLPTKTSREREGAPTVTDLIFIVLVGSGKHLHSIVAGFTARLPLNVTGFPSESQNHQQALSSVLIHQPRHASRGKLKLACVGIHRVYAHYAIDFCGARTITRPSIFILDVFGAFIKVASLRYLACTSQIPVSIGFGAGSLK